MKEHEEKPMVYLPYNILPEGQNWKVGQSYRVKVVLRQVGLEEDGAEFEVVDATSMEPSDKMARKWLTEGGYLKKS